MERENVSLEAAAHELKLRQQAHAENIAGEILKLFKLSVGSTLALVAVLWISDVIETAAHLILPGERIITGKVVMTLIGASVVQVGAASAAIVYGIFAGPKRNDDTSDE